MNRLRRCALAFAVIFTIGFGLGPLVGDAGADDKKHKWKHRDRHERIHRDHGRWHDRDDHRGRSYRHRHDRADRYRWDRDRDRYDRYDRRRYDGDRYRHRSNYDSEKCAEVARRIDRAHYEINKWEGTGRHEGVVSWYKGDLRNALRDRARYCGGRASAGDWRYDRSRDRDWYDRYDSRYDYDDDRDFDFDRDWPALLGLFMNGGVAAGY